MEAAVATAPAATMPASMMPAATTPQGSDGNGTGRYGTRREAILGAIRESPGIGLGELARRIYDEDTPVNRKRVQSLVSVLKRSGAVRAAARGGLRWCERGLNAE